MRVKRLWYEILNLLLKRLRQEILNQKDYGTYSQPPVKKRDSQPPVKKTEARDSQPPVKKT